jgi:hypothetical protein
MTGPELGLKLATFMLEVAPGMLTAIAQSGAASDAEAIEAAREAVHAIPTRPAGSALDAHGSGRDT